MPRHHGNGAPGPGARPLAAGALLAALALVLGVAAYYLPLVGGLLGFIMPLPLALAQLRYGWRLAALSGTVTTLLALIIGGPLLGVFVAAGCAVGVSLGYGVGRGWTGLGTLALASAVGLASSLAGLGVSVLVLGPHTVDLAWQALDSSLHLTGQAMERLGGEALLQSWRATEALVMSAPGAFVGLGLVISSFMYGWLWYATCGPALARLGHPVPPLPRAAPVARWHLPPALGLVAIALFAGLSWLAPGVKAGSLGHLALAVASSLVYLVMVFQGLGLAAHLITRLGLPAPLRRGLVFLAGLFGFLTAPAGVLLFWAGMFDLGLDFRQIALRRRRQG